MTTQPSTEVPTRSTYYQDDAVTLFHGDCIDVMRTLPDASVDSIVTDPPYGLEFMGKGWDAPWIETDVNVDAGFKGGGISATKGAPSFMGSTNPKCQVCKGTRRGRRDGTAKVAVCLCADGGRFPNVRAVEMRAFQQWCELWAVECLRVLKPGGHLLAFGGTRTSHRLAVAVEDAGFEIRDSIAWLYGSGFPKSLDVSKAIDKAAGAERVPILVPTKPGNLPEQAGALALGATGMTDTSAPATPAAQQWQGWGTALKPAHEPIVVGRKPLVGTVAANVLAHGTGALNVDGCRVQYVSDADREQTRVPVPIQHNDARGVYQAGTGVGRTGEIFEPAPAGRWPANVVLDGSQADALDRQSGTSASTVGKQRGAGSGDGWGMTATGAEYDDPGGASRFFKVVGDSPSDLPTFRYGPKAPTHERPKDGAGGHPTVKPLDLMRWLVRLVTPPGGTVLEPFAGSGTTAEACVIEGFKCIAIEREAEYLPLIVQRLTKPMQTALDLGGTA